MRNHQFLLAALKLHQIRKPPLPADTRWNTIRDSLICFKDGWGKFNDLFAYLLPTVDSSQMKGFLDMRNVIEDLDLKHSVVEVLEFLDPLSIALDIVQSDKTTIADAWYKFKELNLVSI